MDTSLAVATGQAIRRAPRKAAGQKVKSTGHSSMRLGACEICDEHCPEVFMRRTTDGLDYVFGHESCLQVNQS